MLPLCVLHETFHALHLLCQSPESLCILGHDRLYDDGVWVGVEETAQLSLLLSQSWSSEETATDSNQTNTTLNC